MNRKGEKLGWIGGWIGSFCWMPAFGIVCFVKGQLIYGAIGTAFFFIALFLILKCVPWKYPKTKYWKLMVPIYTMFLVSVIAVIYVLTGFNDLARIQYGVWMIPCLAPIAILGNKTWD